MVVGELALGVASSLLWEGLKRPIDAIAAEARRHDQVLRPLTGRQASRAAAQHKIKDKSIDDLERVIGNGTGQLTTPVSKFLRDLRTTAIPEAIAQAALCGSEPASLRVSFEAFYGRYADLPFTATQLFDAAMEACRSHVEEVGDPNLLEIIRAQHSVIAARVEAIANTLQKALREESVTTPDQIRDARQRIAKSIQNEHKYVSVETLRGPKKVPLKTISIPSRLSRLDATHVEAAKMPKGLMTQTYLSFRRRFYRAVVVGDPGGGKSTLTQMISADLARLILTEASAPEVKQIEERDLQMPLRIVLRRYEARSSKTSSYSILDHLRDDIKVALDGDEILARGYLGLALGAGEAVVIFDGLDEVLDIGARARMAELIEQFAHAYPSCPILVTSRLVGYREAPLNSEFAIYGLDRFNDDEIGKYSSKAIAAVGQVKRQEAELKSREFFFQSSKVGSDIRDNPLMLGLMVQIFLNRGDVPGNRPEVYKECATLMFEKWDGRREIVADVPRQDIELLDVFGYVASRTFGDAASEEGVTRAWLVDELRRYFEEWYVDRASANRAAKSLVTFLTGRAWVMCEVGQGTYKFTHRTFLEFFFARHLISESKSIDDLIRVDLFSKIINNQWSVISHLALHMAVFRDGGKSKQAADTLEDLLVNDSLSPQHELSFLNFVASSFSYLTISEASYVRMVRLCIQRAIALGSHRDFGASSVIDAVIYSNRLRVALSTQEVSSQIGHWLSSDSRDEMLFSMYVVSRLEKMPAWSSGVQNRSSLPRTEVWLVAKKMQKTIHKYAMEDAALARAYVGLFGDGRVEFFAVHGREFVLSSPSALIPHDVDDLVLKSVRLAIQSARRSGNKTHDDSSKFIAALADEISSNRFGFDGFRARERIHNPRHAQDFEVTFRGLWVSAQIGSKNTALYLLHAQCLVCILASFDPPRPDEDRGRHLDWGSPVPPTAIRIAIGRVKETGLRQWLDEWASKHLPNQGEEFRP